MSNENMVSLHVTIDAKLKEELQKRVSKDKRFVSVSHLTRVLLSHGLKEYDDNKI